MSSILEALKSRPAFDFNAPLSPAHLAQVNDAQSTTISSQDADSLNTLKLLMVFASLIETTLVNWSSKAGTDQANNIASIVGSHLSQVSQAVQNVYTEAISSCVKNLNVLLDKATSRSLSTVISGYPPLTPPSPDMFHSPLRQSLNSGLTQSLVHTSLSQLIESIRRSLSSFKSKLEPMVYIAVVRALWDSFGHQVMCCINEQRGGTSQAAEEMMRSRERAGCAMNVLSEFFCSHLHGLPFEGDKEKLLSFPKRVLEVEQMMNQRAKDRIGDVVNFSPF